jgi:hypothetical protein
LDKRNLKWITWSFVGITIVIVAIMLGSTLRRTSHVTLPPTGTGSGQITENPDDYKTLNEGDRVEFDVTQGDRGKLQASNVRKIG